MIINKNVCLGVSLFVLMLFVWSLTIPSFSFAELSKSKAKQLEETNRELKQRRLEWFTTGNEKGERYDYSYPNDEKMREALKRFLDSMKKAREEINELLSMLSKGKIKITRDICGGYIANVESKTENARFHMVFMSAEGNLSSIRKSVFLDKEKTEEIRKNGYTVYLYGKGNIKNYRRRDDTEGLYFYPSGQLELYRVNFEGDKWYYSKVKEDGTVKYEKIRTKKKRSLEEIRKRQEEIRKRSNREQ